MDVLLKADKELTALVDSLAKTTTISVVITSDSEQGSIDQLLFELRDTNPLTPT